MNGNIAPDVTESVLSSGCRGLRGKDNKEAKEISCFREYKEYIIAQLGLPCFPKDKFLKEN
jgi:hypothetical protein